MQRFIIALLAFAAIAFAQEGPNQIFTTTPLLSTNTYTGTLPPVGAADSLNVKLFAFYVPENVTAINFAFSDTTQQCYYLYFNILTSFLPCSNDQLSSSNYLCANNYNDYSYSGQTEIEYFSPGDSSSLFEYVVNNYWYIGISRYYEREGNETCSFTMTMNYNSSCPMGSTGVESGLSSSTVNCVTYQTVSAGGNGTNFLGNDEDVALFKTVVPVGTGSMTIVLTSNSSYNYVYGRSRGVPQSSYYDCYTSSDTGNGPYNYTVVCPCPRSGEFWIAVTNYYDVYSANIQVSFNVCPAGMGGLNCNYPTIAFTPNYTLPATFAVAPAPVGYTYVYLVLDIPENYSAPSVALTASSPQSGLFMIRRNGWPDYSSGAYESGVEYYSFSHTYTLSGFDYGVAGRVVLGLACYATNGCNITLSGNVSSTSGTTLTTLTSATTTTTSSSSGVATTAPIATTGTTAARTSGVVNTSGQVNTSGRNTSGAVSTTTTTTSTSGSEQSSYASVIVPSVLVAGAALLL